VLLAVGLGVLALAGHFWVFVAGLAVYGLALGVVDATTNMQAVSVENRYQRPILPSFHGAWTAGGITGTLAAIILAHTTLAASLLPLLVLPVLAAVGPLLRHDRPGATAAGGRGAGQVIPREHPELAVPWRRILLLGVAMVLFYMVDTAATAWGPVFLKDTFATPDRLVPLATLPYLSASLLMRISGDRLVHRRGARPVLRGGGLLAALALGVIVVSPTWAVAVLGFTVLGLGVAVIAPLSFSAAAALAGGQGDWSERQARIDQVIARFNQFNYVGALFGAVLTGLVGAGSLRAGFAVPMVLILAIIPLSRAFALVRPEVEEAGFRPPSPPSGSPPPRRRPRT
jgi:predicted MFS family arabinose efflux permease